MTDHLEHVGAESITSNDELEDGTETTPFSLTRIDAKLLTSPVVIGAIVGVVLGVAILVWPNRSDRILARLIGAGLVAVAMTVLGGQFRVRARAWLTTLFAVASLVGGVLLVVNPDQSTVFVGRLVGVLLVGQSVHGGYRALTARPKDMGKLAVFGLIGSLGVLLIGLTSTVISTMVSVAAVGWIVASGVVLVVSLDARTEGAATYASTTELLAGWLNDRPKSVDARQALYDKILYEGPTTQTRIVRFFALMGFASVIAAMGVITESTAVVIGAMLVAPLMTPLMGMAISLVMGWPNRLTRSAFVAFGGILFAIGIGVLLGLIAPTTIDTASNAQILARTSPTTLDLIIAVAAGAAGAYGLSRPDVSDSLPGVAIAISLVPPLTVVGISYSQADWSAGNGALLLFATNMVAILLVGGITFVLTGVTPIARAAENQHRVQTAVVVTCTAAVLILGALLLNGADIATNALRQSTVESTIDEWLGDESAHRLVTAEIDAGVVTAVIVGPTDGLPAVEILADRLSSEFDDEVTVNISLVVEERFAATSGS